MSQTVSLVLSSQTSEAREEIVEDRRHAVKHVLQACIVLLSDERLPVLEVARQAKVSRPMVWRWQQRLAEEGVDGLLRDKTRPLGKPATPLAEMQAVLERTLTGEPPSATTHWTERYVDRLRPVAQDRAADLGRPPPATSSRAHLQALDRSTVRRQA